MTFVLLTGIPRSGTTLAAALIDRMENAICLSEPDEHVALMQCSDDAEGFAASLHAALLDTQRKLVAGEAVADRRGPDGSAITNYFTEPDAEGRRSETFRIASPNRGRVAAGALIAAKHNALFSAVLPELVAARRFRIIAVVRDPVEVIRSWRSLTLPVSAGRLPAADRYWPEMRDWTGSDTPLLIKQIGIYELLCRRFEAYRRDIALVRYEEIVADPAFLAGAVGRDVGAAELSRLRSMIRPRPAATPEDAEIEAAIRSACREGGARALADFYPRYR